MPPDPLAERLDLDPDRVAELQGLSADNPLDRPPSRLPLIEACADTFGVPVDAVRRVDSLLSGPPSEHGPDRLAERLGLDPALVRAHQGCFPVGVSWPDPTMTERIVEAVAIDTDACGGHLADAVQMLREHERAGTDLLADQLGLESDGVRRWQGLDAATLPSTPAERFAARDAFYANRAT